MGAPRKIRKKYEKPKAIWNKERIEEQHKIKERYGLKNLRELWRVETELRRIRRNIRNVLSGRADEKIGKEIANRLSRYNIIAPDTHLDDLFILKSDAILDRRLQSIVFKKGLAKTIKQARQLVTHGFIAINGRRVKSPSYTVKIEEENSISYYKPIDLEQKASLTPNIVESPKPEG